MHKKHLRVFILDDDKPVWYAMEKSGLWRSEGFGNVPDDSCPTATISIARDVKTAADIIRYSEKFDVWAFDEQLSYGEPSGHEFFSEIARKFPDKVPDDVRSCSSLGVYALALDKAVTAWRNGEDPPTDPYGDEDDED